MKKPALITMLALILVSAGSVFAAAPKAADQLALQAPKQEAAVMPEARSEEVAAVITEKGRPVRTIYFQADKGNPLFDVIFGGGGNNNGNNNNYPSYNRLNCVANDEGYEEHWGGHGGGPSEMRACQECLSIHGGCRYNCSTEQFRCTAQFVPALVPGQPQSPIATFPGDPRPDQGSAQDNATMRCLQATQGQQGYCGIQSCNRENQVVHSGRCRR